MIASGTRHVFQLLRLPEAAAVVAVVVAEAVEEAMMMTVEPTPLEATAAGAAAVEASGAKAGGEAGLFSQPQDDGPAEWG